jgi:hypothetical protein
MNCTDFDPYLSLVGLRQKVARKKPQIYIQKDFDIDLPSFLIYLGFKHF